MVFLLSLYVFLYLLNIAKCKGYDCELLELMDGGIVITPNDESYDMIRLNQFGASLGSIFERNKILSPTIIAIPRTEKEIKKIILFANKCRYTISTRSGGHQYSGLSSCNRLNGKCIQIDMKYFNYINYNKDNNNNNINTITVGVGVKLIDLFTKNNENNVAILGGTCPEVGAGGHYQSSADSIFGRSFGSGMDWIIRIKIITANGKAQNLYKNSKNKKEKDLFWAILGGSPGSWGVVIEYEFEPIRNSDYPHSQFFYIAHFYTKQVHEAFFRAFFELLNNPYYYNYYDLTMDFGGSPLLNDSNTSSSIIAISIFWSGIDNGDINSLIPNHAMNKTWFQELIQPFVDIDAAFPVTRFNKIVQAMSISGTLLFPPTAYNVPVPAFRFISTHSEYRKHELDALFGDTIKAEEWKQSYLNVIDELASDPTDNVQIVWQFWMLIRNEGRITDDKVINLDPLKNDISFPYRDIKLVSDNWILFGDGDEYSENVRLKAKQYRDKLKQIISKNELKSNFKSFGYTDLSADEYDLNTQFNQFYHREDVYRKLQDIKTMIDCNNIFYGALTIPPNSCDDKISFDSVISGNGLIYINNHTQFLLNIIISLLLCLLVISQCFVCYDLLKQCKANKNQKKTFL